MAPSSKKRKASELDAAPDLNGHSTAGKGKRKAKKQELANTAVAPDHGYTVEYEPSSDNEDRSSVVLWEEIDWATDYAVHPTQWREIKTYRNFIRTLPVASAHHFALTDILLLQFRVPKMIPSG